MKFSIILDKDDFLIYHLYHASVSKILKKRRLTHWAGVPIVYFITALLLRLLKSPEVIQIIFLVTGILWIFLYPFYSRWAIPRFLTRQISEKYAGLLGKKSVVQISKNQIDIKSDENTMQVPWKDVKGIVELSSHFLIELESGYSLIFPKAQVPEKDLDQGIKLVSQKSEKAVKNQTAWSWK